MFGVVWLRRRSEGSVGALLMLCRVAPHFGVAGEEGATHEQDCAPLSHDANTNDLSMSCTRVRGVVKTSISYLYRCMPSVCIAAPALHYAA
jgi:hypothetical protein